MTGLGGFGVGRKVKNGVWLKLTPRQAGAQRAAPLQNRGGRALRSGEKGARDFMGGRDLKFDWGTGTIVLRLLDADYPYMVRLGLPDPE